MTKWPQPRSRSARRRAIPSYPSARDAAGHDSPLSHERGARIARRLSRNKPIVVVKSGRTGAGRRAASSHTAAMAARDTAVEALVHQAGVIRADTLEEMFDVAAVMSSQPVPAGRRVAVLTNVGGPGILVADACEAAGLLVPELSHDTQAALRAGLSAQAAVTNPVDVVAGASAGQYGRTMRLLGAAEEIDAIIAVFIPLGATRAEDFAREITAAAVGLLVGIHAIPHRLGRRLRVHRGIENKNRGQRRQRHRRKLDVHGPSQRIRHCLRL